MIINLITSKCVHYFVLYLFIFKAYICASSCIVSPKLHSKVSSSSVCIEQHNLCSFSCIFFPQSFPQSFRQQLRSGHPGCLHRVPVCLRCPRRILRRLSRRILCPNQCPLHLLQPTWMRRRGPRGSKPKRK